MLDNQLNDNIRQIEALENSQNQGMKMNKWIQNEIESRDIAANELEIIRELCEDENNGKINYHKVDNDFAYENLPTRITKSFLSDPTQKTKNYE